MQHGEREREMMIEVARLQGELKAAQSVVVREKARADGAIAERDAARDFANATREALAAANARADRLEDAARRAVNDLNEERWKASGALAAARRAVSNLADAAAEKARTYATRAAGQREHGTADEAMYLEARGNSWRDAEEMIRKALAAPAAAAGEDSK